MRTGGVGAGPGRAAGLRGSLAQGGTTWMIIGSMLAALAAYLFQVVGARSLGEVAYAPIGVLWTIQYLLTSVVMAALESWVVRTTTSGDGSTATLRALAPRLVLVVIVVAAASFGLTWLAQDLLLPGSPELVLVVPLLVVSYSLFACVRGVLAARQRFKAYGGVTATESLSRLAAAAVLAAVMPSAVLLALTMPLSALVAATWGGATARRPDRPVAFDGAPTAGTEDGPATVPAVRPTAGPGRFLGVTGTANAAAQLLLAGSPLVLGVLGAGPREVSVLFVTVTAARVPLVIVQGGLLSRLLPSFTRMADSGQHHELTATGLRLLAAGSITAVVGAVVGWFLGPVLVALLFGSGFRPDASTTAAVGAAMVLATAAILTNQVLIARRLEDRLLVVWWGGLAAATATVVTTGSWSATQRVCAGFLVGEVTATVILAAALVIRARTSSTPRDPGVTGPTN